MGLAASVLALTTVGGLATAAYLHQRQARAAYVELALHETTLLHNQALEEPDDLGRWQAAQGGDQANEGGRGGDLEGSQRHTRNRPSVLNVGSLP